MRKRFLFYSALVVIPLASFFVFPQIFNSQVSYNQSGEVSVSEREKPKKKVELPPLDKEDYDWRMLLLANNPPPKVSAVVQTTSVDSNPDITIDAAAGNTIQAQAEPIPLWPAKAPYPNAGAVLPFGRVIAYYGNLYSKQMGILGEYGEEEMLARLQAEVVRWTLADPKTPAIPALHYIAVVAQLEPGKAGKYRLRMPDSEIQKVIAMTEKVNGLVFLDIQVGHSTLEQEIPPLEEYLKLPNVHLGVDPEFSMKTGARPGKVVGTFNAADINFAASFLAKVVQENNLPPKILVVHRYTGDMLTNATSIKPSPEVQVVIHMDGFGGAAKKINTYKQFVYPEPVQFTGFKLFYKNDTKEGATLMTPEDLLKLNPRPIYIQYQ